MPSLEVNPRKGWIRRLSRRAAAGGLLLARNARFLPADDRLWALLGRSKFNANPVPASSAPVATDDLVMKGLFSVEFDGAGGKLVCHKGGALFDSDLDGAGEFSVGFVIATQASDIVPRGIPAAYRGANDLTNWHYPVGRTNFKTLRYLVVRTNSAYRWGGHVKPNAAFTMSNQGSGTFSSSTPLLYGIRIYDSGTGTESQLGTTVAFTPSGTAQYSRLTFAAGVALQAAELGTHLRLYRTLLNEAQGIMYRIDGTGNGIALGSTVPGYTFDDDATNVESQLMGTVRADGQEGTVAWAEHGGAPPKAGACIVFDESMVYYDLFDRKSDIIYSATGYPESCPVDADGQYAYFLRMESDRDDQVVACTKTGGYLLVFGRSAIYRVSKLPTLEDPGFTRRLQDQLTDDHGCVGRFAAASFGIGTDQAQHTLYVAAEHGLMLTDAVSTKQIVPWSDLISLIEPSRASSIQLTNYSSKQELWLAYTPVGGTKNTQAMIVDYSAMSTIGIRVTGPVDVKAEMMHHARGTDGVCRLYLADDTSRIVYVQDSGSTDKQENTNAAGDIQLDWQLGRSMGNQNRLHHVHRLFAYGDSGVTRAFSVIHQSLHGKYEESVTEQCEIGPGETSDEVYIEQAGQGFRTTFTYLGPTGTTYSPNDIGNPPALESVDYVYSDAGEITETRDQVAI
jgi:hypothetical protein